MNHYHAQGRTGPALQLAEPSAATGAAAGHITAGRLYERQHGIEGGHRVGAGPASNSVAVVVP